jgi:hypothetical protein
MNHANSTIGNKVATFCKNVLVVLAISTVLFSCQKEAAVPRTEAITNSNATLATQVPVLRASTQSLALVQANAENLAISLNWGAFPAGSGETQDYRIEAAMTGSRFSDWVEIGSTNQLSIDITTSDFNRQIRKLFVTGFAEDVVLRVKYCKPNAAPAYSYSVMLRVTTYHPVIEYDNASVFRIPGNYENWKVDSAQKIISPKKDGVYEGFINFNNPNTQFLMVKTDRSWNILTTYYSIGAAKFGFGGNQFSIKEGEGFYKFNANTNTNTWSCTKINSWSVKGSAITADGNTDLEMKYNATNKIWEIRGNFNQGNFIIRANNGNEIVFGHNAASEPGVPDYNGAKIEISKAGNYTIYLSVMSAGNYSYGVQRNI